MIGLIPPIKRDKACLSFYRYFLFSMLKALGPFCLKVEAFGGGDDGYGGGY